jgi:hypothetical protein
VLRAADFEARWASMPTVEVWGASLRPGLAPGRPAAGELEAALAAANIACMASGSVGGVAKYFFFAQEDGAGAPQHLAIAELSLGGGRLSGIAKASSPAVGAELVKEAKRALAGTGLLAAP